MGCVDPLNPYLLFLFIDGRSAFFSPLFFLNVTLPYTTVGFMIYVVTGCYCVLPCFPFLLLALRLPMLLASVSFSPRMVFEPLSMVA